MTNFTETRNLIQNNKKNDLKKKVTMTRKQRLKKQLSIYFDILTQEGSHVEISCAAMQEVSCVATKETSCGASPKERSLA